MAFAIPAGMYAQEMDSVLRRVETNNLELQILRLDNEASFWDTRSGNSLGDLSVEYSPFFLGGENGVVASELVVKQEFKFPTAYAAGSKYTDINNEANELKYKTMRRDILLNAKNLCLDLVYLGKLDSMIRVRSANADNLLMLFEKRIDEGDATALELNKIRMDRMNLNAEAARIQAERQTVLRELVALNGNIPLDVEVSEYSRDTLPEDYDALLAEIMSSDYGLMSAEADERLSAQEIKVSKNSWAPSLEIGYRRNTEMREANNGFLVGLSFPLFSSRSKVNSAKAKYASASIRLENARNMVENGLRSKIAELVKVRTAISAYDIKLMKETLSLLLKAVESGEISVITYYMEADGIYQNISAYLELERQYRGILAELYKNRL